jgi:hypothetical protein
MGNPNNDERKLESGGVAPAPTRSIHPAFYIAYENNLSEMVAPTGHELLMRALDYGLA